MNELLETLIYAALIGGFLGGVVTVALIEAWRAFRGRPRLRIEFDRADSARASEPAARVNGASAPSDAQAVVIRARVRNVGRGHARGVVCLLQEVMRTGEEKSRLFDDVSIDLRWSHLKTRERDLAPGEARYVDVCYTVESAEALGVRVAGDGTPSRLAAMLAQPGRFELRLMATCANARPARTNIAVDWEGRWYDLVPWSPRGHLFENWRRTPWDRAAVVEVRA